MSRSSPQGLQSPDFRPENTVPHAAAIPADILRSIADRVGTPAYVYDAQAIDAGIGRWIDAVGDPDRISFAAKANTNLAVLARLERFGVGAEVATPGELARARKAGFPLARIEPSSWGVNFAPPVETVSIGSRGVQSTVGFSSRIEA